MVTVRLMVIVMATDLVTMMVTKIWMQRVTKTEIVMLTNLARERVIETD